MAARHWQWRRANTLLPVARNKHTTTNGVFTKTRHSQWRLYWNTPLGAVRLSPTNNNRADRYMHVYL
jgi:hypothetical protein